jgi:hypothetical protein
MRPSPKDMRNSIRVANALAREGVCPVRDAGLALWFYKQGELSRANAIIASATRDSALRVDRAREARK